jgi:tetratricopeptide (TPR) repeat protein
MQLLERERALAEMDAAFDELSAGTGSVVLVAGEAGIGKTRLAREFARRRASSATVLWGGCDDLSTPRPLGPFRDLAMYFGAALRDTLSAHRARGDVFDALLDAFRETGEPTVAVIEDVHWADAATLDVLKFLGRRVDRIPILLVVTYRSDEISDGHPLSLVLGDLPGYATRRIDLAPLSREAVASLAGSYPGSVDTLFTATAGNPFLVTEALSMPDLPIPPGVRDAVDARMMRLDAEARSVARAVAVVPGRVERRILEQVTRANDDSLAECRSRGLLEFDASYVWYRHELVRGAVLAMLTARDVTDLNVAVMTALIDSRAEVARIVHHAREAGHGAAVAKYGPLAGAEASAASSHREALAHYRAVLDHLDHVDAHARAGVLLDYAVECYLTGDSAEAMNAANRALELAQSERDLQCEGVALRWLSRFHWWLGHAEAAELSGRRAIELLETVPDSPALPMAYSNLAQLHMLAQDASEAEHWATKAIESARRIGDQAALAHALNNLGSTRARVGDLSGLELLRESLDVSLREGLEDHAGRAYANLIWTLLDFRRLDEAHDLLDGGIAYARARELEGSLYYMTAERARLRLLRGEWDEAERDATWVIGRPEEPGITRMPALATLAQLRVRRGDD